MTMIKGFIRLMRPVNAVICGLSVICGGIVGGKPLEGVAALYSNTLSPEIIRIISAAVSASLILSAGNVYNDVCDRTTDSINMPERPLPSGIIEPGTAALFAVFLAIAGLVCAIPLGGAGFSVAVSATALLWLYDTKLKGVPLAGNAVVAFLGGLAFVYGGIAGHAVTRSLLPAVFAVLLHFGREVIKDAADVQGDRSAGIATVATVRGIDAAIRIAVVVFILLAVTVTLPYLFGYFDMKYMIFIMLGVWPALFSPLRDKSETNLRRISLALKIIMPVGIIAVLAGFQGI